MEENKPIHNEEQSNPPNNPQDAVHEQQLNPPSTDEPIVPAVETSDIINPPSDIKDMEVHHHAHDPASPHHKKNWKSYFWEFLMLFLAVFCGFLAEYQLEHKIERERTKELAKNFYEELKNDSVNVVIKSQNRIKQENSLKYLMKYFKDSAVTNVSKTFVLNFQYGINFRTPSLFEPRTVVLEQLKNSGSLRYFKNDELQKLIGDLSVAIQNINDRQALESSIRKDHLDLLLVKHYDFDFDLSVNEFKGKNIFDKIIEYEKSDTLIPFHFKKIDAFDAQGAINVIGYYTTFGLRGTRQIHFQKYIEVNAELLKLLRKEYHLK